MISASTFPAVAISLWTLGIFSVATWALIFGKSAQYLILSRRNRRYAREFWSAPNLQVASEIKSTSAPLARVTQAGFESLRDSAPIPLGSQSDQEVEHSWDRHEQLERNLKHQIVKERRGLETGLAVLASIGSTAPFVGLFGTVWGIMHAMHDIAKVGSASLDVVAGPIGEALIATGIGIATAIPAVLAYNFFLRRAKATAADLDDFANDFINIAQRASYRVEREVRLNDVRSTSRHRDAERPQPILVGAVQRASAEHA